jgi:RHS repeat-associated protein
VERWTDTSTGDVHWRTTTRDGITSIFGRTPSSRVADPDEPTRVFSWLLDVSYDGKGNAVTYEYKPEDMTAVPTVPAEAHRGRAVNQYLKRIRYGPATPYSPNAPPGAWHYTVVLDYGEHDPDTPTPQELTDWVYRPDAFSSYRCGFEIRTRRLCSRILMFHSFTELSSDPVLVSSTDLRYAGETDPSKPAYSQLTAMTRTGYLRSGDGYAKRSLPPVDFGYSAVALGSTVEVADSDVLANLPAGVDESRWQWADLDGEGLQGVLTADDRAWYYKRNLSAYRPDASSAALRFGPMEVLATKPAGTAASSRLSLMDLHGDGALAAVDFSPPLPGFHARTPDGGWAPFTPFTAVAAVELADPNVRRVDLDGDGLADLLLTCDDEFVWFAWQGSDGYAPGGRVATARDEESAPALVLAGSDGSVFLADMTGDGLSDLVRIRNGEICYWPNLGYGRFGAKVLMAGAPLFDNTDVFTGRRVRLADFDGSGTADLIYFGASGATLWFNQSGNGFSQPTTLDGLPGADDRTTVSIVDLLGAGTSCVAWSTSGPGTDGRELRYVDLLPGGKPHLLTAVDNNLGARTSITYATSTRYYLQDRLGPYPWITRLAFPVHVVERIEVNDIISGTRLVTTYAYHHGHYDGVEREFRGFAMVEQSDAEFVNAAAGNGTFTNLPTTLDGEFALPPARTCTWIHTGAFVGECDIAAALATQYWDGDSQALRLADNVLPSGAGSEDLREAARALRGKVLRVEVYADDGAFVPNVPFTVTTSRYEVRRLQPAQASSRGRFLPIELETLASTYERVAADPRVQHSVNLMIDGFGTVLKAATLAYPRRSAAFDEQQQVLATIAEHDVTHIADRRDWYRLAVPIEARQYEVGLTPRAALFTVDDLLVPTAEVGYEDAVGAGQRRLFARTRMVYRSDDLASVLAGGSVESLAILDRTYVLALTAQAASLYYTGAVSNPGSIAFNEGGWLDLDSDGSWWGPSGRLVYSADPAHPDAAYARTHFFLPQGEQDAFGGLTTVGWDVHNLVPTTRTDPVGNTTTAGINYRLMQPWLLTDSNGNRTGARFDELGLVLATAVMGKRTATGDEADHLDLTTLEASPSDDPTETYVYDLTSFGSWAADPTRNPSAPAPCSVHQRSRVRHKDPATEWIERYVYSDGFGRVVLTKAQAEPGTAPQRDAGGALVRDLHGALVFADTDNRWVGTGRVVHDNKGNPVKSYEPFFDSTPAYESEADLVEWGVTSVTRYDPLSRAVRVDKPDGTFVSTEFDGWRQLSSDENDNVLISRWYSERSGGGRGPDEQDAATKTAAHADTPHVTDLDPLGRVFRTVEDGPSGQLITKHTLDIAGRVTAVVDASNRHALLMDHDMTGTTVHTTSIDAGQRWSLADAATNPVRQWDSRSQQVRHGYDRARRPLATFLTVGGGGETTCTVLSYGEGVLDDAQHNLRGTVHEERDQAGIATVVSRDFHGKVLSATRQVTRDPGADIDWAHPPVMDDTLTTATSYDALSRVVSTTTPDGSVTTPTYTPRSQLAGLSVQVRGAMSSTFVDTVSYDAKGQRLHIAYGSGAATLYTYDPQTFRVVRLQTTRPGSGPVQDMTYTYDPVGNVTRSADAAQSTIFFANQLVAPTGDYRYDQIYRLLGASGREHIGQATGWDDVSRQVVPIPTDPNAMRNYTQTYVYDLIGNLTSVRHSAAGGSWTRSYRYDEPNASPTNNHLSSTQVGATAEPYSYDGNGNVSSMPHLSSMSWDYRNQLRSTATQIAAGPVPSTWYQYDTVKTRLRKALLRPDGSRASERLYLGTFERYREFAADGTTVTLERQTLVIPDGTRHLALVETTVPDTAHPAAPPVTTTRYQFEDRLGSSSVELDENAAVITYEEYYPFGSTSFQAGRSQAEVSLKRYRYTGRERDTETGFNYHGLRYYAPWLGRWISTDPGGLVDGTGLYTYCRNNPTRLVDPAGTDGNEPDPKDPTPEPVPPPTSAVSGFGITPPGTSTLFYSVALNRQAAAATAYGLVGQAGVVAGLTDRLQLQLAAGPLYAHQSSPPGTPDTNGTLFTGQLQWNLDNKDPQAASNFVVFTGNLSSQQQGTDPTTYGGTASAAYGHERILRIAPGFDGNDYNHPSLQLDVNLAPGLAINAGGITPGTTFTTQGSLTASVALTSSSGYRNDAVNFRGQPVASNLPARTVGLDLYLTGGYGNLAGPSGAADRGAVAGTVGLDVFGSFTSVRLDSGQGPGNNRLTLGWSAGGFLSGDTSGPGASGSGSWGLRASLVLSFGRGVDPPRGTPPRP